MQTSYEVVRNAIEFNGPDRLPLMFSEFGLNDTHRVDWNQSLSYPRNKKKRVDYWGCIWERSDVPNMGQIKGHPLDNWSKIDSYQWPDADSPEFYKGMEEKFKDSESKYVITNIFMLLFERMQGLRGFENLLMDLVTEPIEAGLIADKIVDFNIRVIENIYHRFPGRIHGFDFTDDWGAESALLISPTLWRWFFKPRYERIFKVLKHNKWHIWMHSCGHINEIIEDLIEMGCNVLNLEQPRTLGIEAIGEMFRGRICFSTLCDIQVTLPFKGQKEIMEEAILLLKHWASPHGGFILSDYGNGAAIWVPKEKKRIMLDAFVSADPYK